MFLTRAGLGRVLAPRRVGKRPGEWESAPASMRAETESGRAETEAES